jgi:hypothetical protein
VKWVCSSTLYQGTFQLGLQKNNETSKHSSRLTKNANKLTNINACKTDLKVCTKCQKGRSKVA